MPFFNEFLFFSHILLLMLFLRISTSYGKSALIAICTLQGVLANLFVLKTINLFSLSVTPSDAYTIGCMIAINLLRESYGKQSAKQVIRLNVLLTLFFLAMSLMQIAYQPDACDLYHSNYAAILTPSLRILLASLTAFFISQLCDYSLYGIFRKHLSFRSTMILTLLISQLIDTSLFSFLGLYGIVSNITDILCFSYLIKVITLLCMGYLTKPLLQKKVKNA